MHPPTNGRKDWQRRASSELLNQTDGQLVTLFRASPSRRDEVLEVLYGRYAEDLRRYFSAKLGQGGQSRLDAGTDSYDLVHDLFLRMYVGEFGDFDVGRSLRAYLFRAGFYTLIDHLRREKVRQTAALADDVRASHATAHEEALAADLWNRLLVELTPDERLVMEAMLQGEDSRSTAAKLRMTVKGVYRRTFAGRKKIWRYLEQFQAAP